MSEMAIRQAAYTVSKCDAVWPVFFDHLVVSQHRQASPLANAIVSQLWIADAQNSMIEGVEQIEYDFGVPSGTQKNDRHLFHKASPGS